MRIMLFACVLLIVASTGASSMPSSELCVGLYAEASRSIMSVDYPGAFMPFELWIWWLPSEHGLAAAMYQITYPSNVIQGNLIVNPLAQVNLGCVDPQLCAVFETNCQMDWVWTHRRTCFLTDALPGFIEIGPPGPSTLEAANCDLGYPMEAVTILNKFGVNQEAVVAVGSRSWGAIKSLYR